MGHGIQEGEKTSEGDIGLQREDTEEVRSYGKGEKTKPGRRQQERPAAITDADQIRITCEHFFGGGLNEWMDEVHDLRKAEQRTYSSRHLFWLGILMFLFRLGSRRQLLFERETAQFHSNLLSLSGTDEELVAHTDTMNNLLEMVEPAGMEMVKVKMIRRLIADKRLDDFRLYGEFLVAVDGTGLFSFRKQHCEQCLKTEHSGGAVTWSHKMLDAKLVSEDGFAMSICSEPIENENGCYDKQDCELKAFYRLAKKLKKLFPRVRICLLLDGLYACKEVFDICTRSNWSFIIVFKEGRIPILYAEAVRIRNAHPKNSLTVRNFVRRLTESFRNCAFSEYAWSLPRNIQIRFSSA